MPFDNIQNDPAVEWIAAGLSDMAREEIKNVNYASVIMYHRFGDSRYPSTNIKKEQFMKHINELLLSLIHISEPTRPY